MASGSTPHNRSRSATIAQGHVLSSIGENATNVRIPLTQRSLQITKIDELEPSLTCSAWTIHASVTKKRGQVPFLFRENGQYTEVYLQDVKTVSLMYICLHQRATVDHCECCKGGFVKTVKSYVTITAIFLQLLQLVGQHWSCTFRF